MRLATAQAVREKITFSAIDDVNAAINSALDSATAQLEQALSTEFSAQSLVDVFYIDRCVEDASGNKTSRLYFSQGFIKASPAMSLVYAPARSLLSTEGVPITNIDIKREVGVASIFETDLEGCYVKASYSAGFDPDGSDPLLYTQSQVPDWLKQAAIAAALLTLRVNPLFNAEGSSLPDKAVTVAELDNILASHIRYRPAYKPPID